MSGSSQPPAGHSERYHLLADVMLELEQELRRRQQWESRRPPSSALASVMPFCADTLKYPQWLQWVMIPRMREIIEEGGHLPSPSNITAMAEEYFKSVDYEVNALLRLCRELDRLLNMEIK